LVPTRNASKTRRVAAGVAEKRVGTALLATALIGREKKETRQ
jgi:hypothetical protein